MQGFYLEVVFESEGKWHSLKVTGKDCVDLAEEGLTKGTTERERASLSVYVKTGRDCMKLSEFHVTCQ